MVKLPFWRFVECGVISVIRNDGATQRLMEKAIIGITKWCQSHPCLRTVVALFKKRLHISLKSISPKVKEIA